MGIMKYALIDVNNLVHRAKHTVSHYDTFDECVSMTLDRLFGSLRKVYEKFGAEHCVACFDQRSWRKDVFPDYKGDRNQDESPIKLEEREIIKQVLINLEKFLTEHTNVTVLSRKGIEADDFIARWVQLHDFEDVTNIIVSADRDFMQLIRRGVELFDPIGYNLFTHEGIFFQDGKKKAKHQTEVQRHGERWKIKCDPKTDEELFVEPEWSVFVKCIRGKKNNLPCAFPRVRETKMRAAFEDKGGPKWNAFINTIWGDEENRQSVRKKYDFNRRLFDLKRQPQNIIDKMDEAINEAMDAKPKQMVGAWFAKFCGKYRLVKLVTQAAPITALLASKY